MTRPEGPVPWAALGNSLRGSSEIQTEFSAFSPFFGGAGRRWAGLSRGLAVCAQFPRVCSQKHSGCRWPRRGPAPARPGALPSCLFPLHSRSLCSCSIPDPCAPAPSPIPVCSCSIPDPCLFPAGSIPNSHPFPPRYIPAIRSLSAPFSVPSHSFSTPFPTLPDPSPLSTSSIPSLFPCPIYSHPLSISFSFHSPSTPIPYSHSFSIPFPLRSRLLPSSPAPVPLLAPDWLLI